MKSLVLIFAFLVLFSCEKAELPKPVDTTVNTGGIASVSMGANYENTLYYDLESRTVVKSVLRTSWDLAFSTDAAGSTILLNGGKMMAVAVTAASELSQVTSSSNVMWMHDSPSGRADSLALSGWELNRVYLLDRGVNTAGAQIGKMKFRITAHDASAYTIEWAKVSATSGFQTAVIPKDASKNFVCFYLDGAGSVVDVEPSKNSWDLCFGSYTHIYPDGMPYLVNGVLSNKNLVRVVAASEAFADITLAKAVAYTYPSALNVIGYNWKTYDFGAALYVVNTEKVYVVQSVEGNYFKLRFVSFYDDNGIKGTPSFELVQL